MESSYEATGPTYVDYESYQTVVQLVSAGIQDEIRASLRKLQDPDSFHKAVGDLASAQGFASAVTMDLMSLYDGFWRLANGIEAELSWRNSSGIPVRSAMIGDSLQPTQPPAPLSEGPHTNTSLGLGAFGIGIGISW